jgi:hypothetical protein
MKYAKNQGQSEADLSRDGSEMPTERIEAEG